VCIPNVVFAAETNKSCPSAVYDSPQCKKESSTSCKKDDCNDTELERLVMHARQSLDSLGPVKKVTDEYATKTLVQMKKGYERVLGRQYY